MRGLRWNALYILLTFNSVQLDARSEPGVKRFQEGVAPPFSAFSLYVKVVFHICVYTLNRAQRV